MNGPWHCPTHPDELDYSAENRAAEEGDALALIEAHQRAPADADWSEFEDDLSDAISDSIDMDWTGSVGAKAVVRWLNENAPRAAPEVEPARTWWFLENHDGEWLENEPHGDFTRDPNKALKWPNAQAASQARNQMRSSLWAALKLDPTAHRWVSTTGLEAGSVGMSEANAPIPAVQSGAVAWLVEDGRGGAWATVDRDDAYRASRRDGDRVTTLYAAPQSGPLPGGVGEDFRAALYDAWTDFLDANPDDLTSPEDLPDHALVTADQMVGIVDDALAALSGKEQG